MFFFHLKGSPNTKKNGIMLKIQNQQEPCNSDTCPWSYGFMMQYDCYHIRSLPFSIQPPFTMAHLMDACRKLDKSKFEKSDSTIHYVDSQGNHRWKGSSKLKATQVYTPSFGRAEPGQHVWVVDPMVWFKRVGRVTHCRCFFILPFMANKTTI